MISLKNNQQVHVLQRLAFKRYADTPFKSFAFLSTSAVGKKPALAQHLAALPDATLLDLGRRAKVLNVGSGEAPPRAFLLEVKERERALEGREGKRPLFFGASEPHTHTP